MNLRSKNGKIEIFLHLFSNKSFAEVGNVARRDNKQNFKVEFKNIFLFYLTVLFCCDVGVSDRVLKSVGSPQWGLSKKCNVISENEVLYQKFMCVVYYVRKKKERFSYKSFAQA